jgi:hypothetical protein
MPCNRAQMGRGAISRIPLPWWGITQTPLHSLPNGYWELVLVFTNGGAYNMPYNINFCPSSAAGIALAHYTHTGIETRSALWYFAAIDSLILIRL